MVHYLTAKNEIEAKLFAVRKFFANDRRVSFLAQATSNKPVFKCELVGTEIKVERVK